MAGASSGLGTSSSTGPRRPRSCPAGSRPPTGAARPCAGPAAPGPGAPTRRPGRSTRPGSASNAGRPRAGRSGLFPDHAATWGWLDGAVRGLAASLERPPELLSLFGYTGGATLLAARAGARVAHVDASKPAVAWARRNAEAVGAGGSARCAGSSMTSGRSSDASVAAGTATTASSSTRRRTATGPSPWKIDTDLPPLLDDLAALLGPRPGLVVLSAHTPGLRRRTPRRAVPRASRRGRRAGRAPADRAQRQRPAARRLGAVARAAEGSAKMVAWPTSR